MRIVFIDNLLFEDKSGINRYVLQPHLGLISLIAVAESGGHEGLLYDPKIRVAREGMALDCHLYRRIADDVLRMEPDVVGLTSLGCNFICTAKVSNYLKAVREDLPILLGGPHATVLDRQILHRFPQFDVIVRNEAELKLLPLLEALPRRSFRGVPGITYRQGTEIVAAAGEPVIADLDGLPWPAYHRYPIKELGLRSLRVDAGRGCPFSCSFCSTATFFGRKYRLKSAGRLRAHLDRLYSEYSITDFSLTHDLFTVSRKKVLEFCEAVQGSGYTWKCSARMDCVDPELLEAMYHAGCREIYYGIEAGTPRMQELSLKKLDLSLFGPTLDKTQEVGMSATVSFITGYPQEEQADQDGTLDMMGYCFYRNRRPLNVQLHLLSPEPGTQLVAEYAHALRYDGHVSDFNFPALEDDDARIMSGSPDVFMNHHYFESVLPRRQHVFVTSVYQVLFALGAPVLSHLLDLYEKRLGALMSSLWRDAELLEARPPYDPSVVPACLKMHLGSGHYLVSIARYMIAASRLSGRLPGRSHAVFGPRLSADAEHEVTSHSRRYVLSSTAAVLRYVHDCPRILDFLAKRHRGLDATIPDELVTGTGHYLVFYETRAADVVRNFQLNEASAAILEFLAEPREPEQLAAAVAAPLGREELDSFLAEAVRRGVVVSVPGNHDLMVRRQDHEDVAHRVFGDVPALLAPC
jgi:radical SAM superfamily enzyme YgiQ (UPF0313 family)